MPDTTSPSQPTDPKAGLIVAAAAHLVPLFRVGSITYRDAHDMAMSAIAAYHPESRSDYVNIARTIAFSMAALALLAKATHADMPTPDLMRIFGRANALNRSADQSERTMIQRRTYHAANPPAALPAWMDPSLETAKPDSPVDDAVFQAAVAEAMREYAAAVAPSRAEPPLEPPRNAAAPPSEPSSPATTPAATIRYAASTPGISLPSSHQNPAIAQADQPPTAPYKATLLRNAAMPPAAIRSTG